MVKSTLLKKPRRPSDQDHCARRQEEILDMAARLFAEHGYSETDTQLLADQLGVGKGTLYRYFPSKRELFLAAADRVMVRLRKHVDSSIEGIADPLDQLAAAIRAYLAFFAEQPGYVELLIQERAQFKDRKKPTYFEHRERNIQRWRDMYQQLMDCGRIRPMPVERITNVLGNLVYGTMFTNYFTGPNKPFEEQAAEILDIVFQGILTDSERKNVDAQG
jgi:AcrR family transcriptional regulator